MLVKGKMDMILAFGAGQEMPAGATPKREAMITY